MVAPYNLRSLSITPVADVPRELIGAALPPPFHDAAPRERPVLDLEPRVARSGSVRRVDALGDDALVVAVDERSEERFAVRVDVLDPLYSRSGCDCPVGCLTAAPVATARAGRCHGVAGDAEDRRKLEFAGGPIAPSCEAVVRLGEAKPPTRPKAARHADTIQATTAPFTSRCRSRLPRPDRSCRCSLIAT